MVSFLLHPALLTSSFLLLHVCLQGKHPSPQPTLSQASSIPTPFLSTHHKPVAVRPWSFSLWLFISLCWPRPHHLKLSHHLALWAPQSPSPACNLVVCLLLLFCSHRLCFLPSRGVWVLQPCPLLPNYHPPTSHSGPLLPA